MQNINTALKITNGQAQIAFNATVQILKKWRCSTEEQLRLLALKKSTFYKYQSQEQSSTFNPDLIERLSYILNIHASLRILFSHPDSVYGWVSKPNNAPFFDGRSALEIMLQGRVIDLWSVASRLNAERGGRA
jgi:Antitoxin Xre/MbcA/ParS C-terminal toxin-binding domain/Antitoxin Xre-like helix-turn-helix domain